jgi:hypothetical protein
MNPGHNRREGVGEVQNPAQSQRDSQRNHDQDGTQHGYIRLLAGVEPANAGREKEQEL